jgi:hypothetical protein
MKATFILCMLTGGIAAVAAAYWLESKIRAWLQGGSK